MPATTDLTINQGETYRQQFVWKTGIPLAAVDLTGCTARLQVRSSASSLAVLVSLTTENGGIILGGILGTIDLFLSATDTSALSFEYGVFDLEIVLASGDVKRLLGGSVVTTKEITR